MRIDKAIISKYTAFFHDGSLIAIDYGKNDTELTLTMESAEVAPEELPGNIALSDDDRVTGKLHLKGVKNIYIDRKKLLAPLKMNYDDGDIFRFRIKENKVYLHIIWNNYPLKHSVDDCSTVTIDVENLYWENIPDLET